jgi:hypothetical protein
MKIFRHGDLLIKEIKELPKNLKEQSNGSLALGEVTGHSHELEGGKYRVLVDESNKKFLEIMTATMLKHQEHKTITIAPAKYEVIIEQEYSPFDEEIRKVAD